MFNKELLNYIVCPISRKPLTYDEINDCLISKEFNIVYPIINGIPNLIINESIKINNGELIK
ncbi:MAG TPA: Trm112 family protein [Burkholderiales bacterium]|nr:Trm112 family protein [Burkholderiales bacterium]